MTDSASGAVAAATAEDIDYIQGLDEIGLASALIGAAAGTEFDDAGPDSASAFIVDNLNSGASIGKILARAERIFKRAWASVRDVVCKAYREQDSIIIGDKPLFKYLTDLVILTLGISGAFAAALIAWAFKLGMDNLCPVG